MIRASDLRVLQARLGEIVKAFTRLFLWQNEPTAKIKWLWQSEATGAGRSVVWQNEPNHASETGSAPCVQARRMPSWL
jgi:hypothetical protein